MTIDVPGRGILTICHVVFDFNGTLAQDGRIETKTVTQLQELKRQYQVMIATADTFGTAAAVAKDLGLSLQVVKSGRDKEALVQRISSGVAAVGNGVNDQWMFKVADLAIAVLGPEGTSVKALAAADIVVPSIDVALGLFLTPNRLIATLRE
ncbi:MAG: haloacid dehalogenase [Sulfobacillus acidophilus]|uniref:Haloacid dehalogenase n=1 Tax=Sulfobacillus acidophilus TaxID=53633 RepID=A0A2T2WD60_9FIRM|nr:MAG: haloacid dehalogenase [Sulfobacillus acidophilus]